MDEKKPEVKEEVKLEDLLKQIEDLKADSAAKAAEIETLKKANTNALFVPMNKRKANCKPIKTTSVSSTANQKAVTQWCAKWNAKCNASKTISKCSKRKSV